jgi:hypothetical protein
VLPRCDVRGARRVAPAEVCDDSAQNDGPMRFLRSLALGACFAACALPAAASDAIPSGHTGTLALGANWGAYETYKGVSFRWVDNDAEIVLQGGSGEVPLAIACSGGPSLGQETFPLRVLDRDRRQVDHVMCMGRDHPGSLLLPVAGGETRYVLHVDGGGRPVPGEKRILNFQVFSLDDTRPGAAGGDVVDPRNGVQLTDHWFPIEHFKGQTFRWMDGNGGTIVVHDDRAQPATLRIVAEVGPSVGAKSTDLAVRDAGGKTVFRTTVSGRRVLLVPVHLNRGDTAFTLVVSSRGLHVPGDRRILNLRVFSVAALR